MKEKLKKIFSFAGSFIAGALNGLLGAGGGMLVIPTLKAAGLSQQKAHATCVAIILPICLCSTVFYLSSGRVTIGDALPYLLWGAVGSVIGARLLPKLNGIVLKRIFSVLMLWAGIRMLLR